MLIFKSLLFLLYILILIGKSGSGFPYGSLQGIASPYFFNIAQWEIKHILSDGWHAIRYGKQIVSAQEDVYLVNRYENLKAEIAGLEKVLRSGSTGSVIQTERDLKARLESLHTERKELEEKVKFVLVSQISITLDKEGLTYPFPIFRDISLLFPAVAYSPSELPNLLIISPREKIEMIESILLVPEVSQNDINTLENMVETKGVSALVERVGGIATYPSLLSEETGLPNLLETIAHEWFHQYLFFHPLGRNYRKDYQMTIINETVADLGGREIAKAVLERYYPGIATEKQRQGSATGPGGQGIEFNKEMRSIRLRVDALLSQGKIIEAEKFMEESRISLARNGYFIRKLNQAYFAFHGSYGEGPASTSPIGPLLRQIRERSGSLGDFIKIVSQISSSEQLADISR